MVSAFASQLQAIAKNSSHELDLRAQRNAHAESLLFDKSIAVKQDFETIYNICLEGFYELCNLDSRFRDFERNVFSEQSKSQDREHMTKIENQALDLVLKRCLSLIGGKILLSPAVKAVEWLVRRFRIHIHNVDDLLHTLLPYHESPIWATTLSIIPDEKVVGQWKFVRPYLKTTWNVPRHAIAHAAAHNDAFFSGMNQYVLDTCRQGLAHLSLMRHWSSIVVEAVSNRSAQTLSGRKEVQKQRAEDQLLKILPLLSDAFDIPGSSDLIATCYAIVIVLVSKIDLDDRVLDSLLLVAATSILTADGDATSAIIVISIVATRKTDKKIPKKVLETLANLQNFAVVASSLVKQYSLRQLMLALIDAAVSHIKPKNAHHMVLACEKFTHLLLEFYRSQSTKDAFAMILVKVTGLNPQKRDEVEVRTALVSMLQRLSENPTLSIAMSEAMSAMGKDPTELENILGMVISLPQSPPNLDIEMIDTSASEYVVKDIWIDLPHTWEAGSSFVAASDFARFLPMAAAFKESHKHKDMMIKFSELPIWSSVRDAKLLWRTFLLRLACKNFDTSSRVAALDMLIQSIRDDHECEPYQYVPYVFTLMANNHKKIRKIACSLLLLLQGKMVQSHNKHKSNSCSQLYVSSTFKNLDPEGEKSLSEFLTLVVIPTLEECVLDSTYISQSIQKALGSNVSTDLKKSHRKTLQAALIQHALSTQLLKVKAMLVSMLADLRPKDSLLSIYQWWSSLGEEDVSGQIVESGLDLSDVDGLFTRLIGLKDVNVFGKLALSSQNLTDHRASLVLAFFESMRHDWPTWNSSEKFMMGQKLFELAFSEEKLISSCSRDLLQAVEIPSGILAAFLQLAQVGSSDLRNLPSSRRRRRSSSNQQPSREKVLKDLNTAIGRAGFALELVDNNRPELKPELLGSLFESLAHLKRIQEARISSPYLTNLCLGSIRVILARAETAGTDIDVSGIRSDLVIDCLRSFDNVEVQNTALLVCASLSRLATDSILHNVMSIFAFIGNTISAKDDEHSINVVNEAMDKIVPALVDSLKKSGRGVASMKSLATVLTSFTSAYDHFTAHRRVAFYQRLISRLGLDEYGYLLVAMLAVQTSGASFNKFLQDLLSGFDVSSQLKMFQQLTILTLDASLSVPKFSAPFLNIDQTSNQEDRAGVVGTILEASTIVLDSPSLKANASKLLGLTDVESEARNALPQAFSITLDLIQRMKMVGENALALSKRCLELLLGVTSLAQLLDMLMSLLDELDVELQPLALRALALQLTTAQRSDKKAKDAALHFLAKLENYVRNTSENALILSSLSCMERISEMYGRKDPDAIIKAAETIAGSHFSQSQVPEKLKTSMILTLTSMVEVLREACVPVVPLVLDQVLDLLAPSSSRPVISAAYLLLATIVSHAPFMVDELQLKRTLLALTKLRFSKSVSSDDSEINSLLNSIASKIDLEIILATSSSILSDGGADNTETTTCTLLDVCAHAIEKYSKSVVMKEANTFSELIILVLQRQANRINDQQFDNGEIPSQDVSTALKTASIKFIYKINDTTLRPIFASWVDWATSTASIDNSSGFEEIQREVLQTQVQRQTVLFDLLTHFFDTLKAIVTSYASYLVKPISTILTSCTCTNSGGGGNEKDKNVNSSKSNPSSRSLPIPSALLSNTLTLLQTISDHDADGFLASPSYFDSLATPLINTLTLSARKSTRSLTQSHTIPAIIALTTATQDSPSTHNTLASQIVALRRHSSSHVRYASIQTLLAITDNEDVGDEFLANTIGVGSVGEAGGKAAVPRGGGSSAGDIMIYVNEMLEDDDEDVERSVRLWVQTVREKIGEEIFAE